VSASVTLRPFQGSDRPFVHDSFLRSFGGGTPKPGEHPRGSAYAQGVPATVLHDMLDPLLVAWDVTVAVSPHDADELMGWICARKPDCVAWLYVKPQYRRAGLGRALLEHTGIGTFVELAFAPTKLFGRPFMVVASEKHYRIRHRPYLPLIAAHAIHQAADIPR
jgi:GNAT superfamily N-acetyltransferase